MQKLTLTQLDKLAEQISDTTINGNYRDALAALSVLEPFQAMYILNNLTESLPDSYYNTLMQMSVAKMNNREWLESVRELGNTLVKPE